MDTNICLYCERNLEKVNIYQSVFCSRLCHEKEALKTVESSSSSLDLSLPKQRHHHQLSFIRKSIRNVNIVSSSSLTSLESL
ncbi:unnamed protein product [Cunninghamella blakesleeana]